MLCMSKSVSVCAKEGGGLPWLLEGEAMLAVGRPSSEEDGESRRKDIHLSSSQAV